MCAAAEGLADALSRHWQALEGSGFADLDPHSRLDAILDGEWRALIDAVQTSEELASIRYGMVPTHLGDIHLGPDEIARALTSLCAHGLSPDAAIEEVKSWRDLAEVEVEVLQTVTTLRPLQPIPLGDRITFYPAPDFESQADDRYVGPLGCVMHPYRTYTEAQGVLVQRATFRPGFVPYDDDNSALIWSPMFSEIDRCAEQAELSLALAANLGVEREQTYSLSPQIVAIGQQFNARGHHRIGSWRGPKRRDLRDAMLIHQQLEDFAPEDKPTLLRALRRFNRAHLQNDPVDAHLDLGIVAESILLHEKGGSQHTGEVNYRLSQRGALLLGRTLEERKVRAAAWKQYYKHRSAAAHSGVLGSKWQRQDLDDAFALCRDLLRSIAARKALIGNWDEIVFAGNPEQLD